jgi:hypothetical protein
MAFVMSLDTPVTTLQRKQMSRILNVTQKVGLRLNGAVNSSDDVRAVQELLAIAVRDHPIKPAPRPTGTFDAITGFWIFDAQSSLRKQFGGEIVDGVVSPAQRGRVMYGPGMWIIVFFNATAMDKSE